MRIFAGILLVLMFVVNGIAGVGYTIGGAFVGGVGAVAEDVGKSEQQSAASEKQAAASASDDTTKSSDEKMAAKDAQNGTKAVDAGKTAKAVGAGLAGLGMFLLALAIGQLTFGVMLFIGKVPKIGLFIIAALGIGAEVAGAMIVSFGIWNILGIATAIAVVVTAITAQQQNAAATPALAGAPYIPPGAMPPGSGGYGAPPGNPGAPPGYGSPPGAPPGYGPPGGGPPMA